MRLRRVLLPCLNNGCLARLGQLSRRKDRWLRASRDMPETGCGAIKIFLPTSRSRLCETIPHFRNFLPHVSRFFAIDCSAFRIFLHSSSSKC